MDETPHEVHPLSRGSLLGFALVVIAGCGAVLWANVWKSELKVKEVRVYGNRTVSADAIITAAAIQKTERLYDVDLFAAVGRVMRNHFLKSAAIMREVPSRITIEVVERVPIAAVMLNDLLYVDAEGYVLPSVVSDNIFDIPVLTGEFSRDELVPGRQIASSALKEAIGVLALAQRIDEQLYRRISEVHSDGKSDLVFYTAEAGVPVIVGHGDVGVKLVKFDSFWKQRMERRGPQDLQYIDLRFQDQVVVKWNQDKGNGHEGGGVREL